jgi:hypothetical protein
VVIKKERGGTLVQTRSYRFKTMVLGDFLDLGNYPMKVEGTKIQKSEAYFSL